MRKTYSPEFKAKLVMEVLRGERMLNEIAKIRKQTKDYEAQIEELYKQIVKLTAQYEWMKKNLESHLFLMIVWSATRPSALTINNPLFLTVSLLLF